MKEKKNLFLHNFFFGNFQSDEERIWSKQKFFSEASKTCTPRRQALGRQALGKQALSKQSRNITRRQARKQLDKLKTWYRQQM